LPGAVFYTSKHLLRSSFFVFIAAEKHFCFCGGLVMSCVRLYRGYAVIAGIVAALAVQAQQPPEATPTFRAQANLVVVDVVVTDAHNQPVEHLSPGDFTVLEDGHPQTVKVFEEHVPQTVAAHPLPTLAPGIFTNRSAVADGGALNVLVIDKLNTPLADQAYLRNQLVQYLKESRPGQRTAIFGLTTRLYLLQGFASDPKTLSTLLEGKKGLPSSSSLLEGVAEGSDNEFLDSAQDAFGDTPDGAILIADLIQFDAEQQAFQQQLRVRYTLDAFNQLARYLANLPGRKNLLWFSGAFPLSILPDGDLKSPFAIVADASDEFRQTVDLLERGQVAVYPIDARGLQVAPMLSAANSGRSYTRNPGNYARDLNKFSSRLAGEQSTMKQMAEATGGEAFVNTNGLKEAMQKATELGTHYYTLAYSPTHTEWKGEYRHIQVKFDRPGIALAYRHGYYADDPAAQTEHQPSASANAPLSPYNPIRAAMLHGAPVQTEILFEAEVLPRSTTDEATPVATNQPEPKIKGPFRNYQITYHADPRGIACADAAQGAHMCRIDFVAHLYDADGALVNRQNNGVQLTIPAAKFQAMMSTRLGFHQQISVPSKGEFYLRLAVRDPASGRIGALELPVAAVAKLPVVARPAALPVPGH
jgi:VWFA-related protein